MIIRVLVHLKNSQLASNSTNKLCLFSISYSWYITVIDLSIPTDCISYSVSLILTCVRNCERSKNPFFQRSKKHFASFRIWWNGDDSVDIGAQQYLNNITGNVELNLEEARLAKCNVFTDIAAMRHLAFLTVFFKLIIQASVQDHDADCSCHIAFGNLFFFYLKWTDQLVPVDTAHLSSW